MDQYYFLQFQIIKGDKDYDNNLNELYQYNYEYKTKGHYMVVTEIIKDDIVKNKKVMLKVSSWGELFYIDFDEYIKYIEEVSGKWTSSIVYMK